VVVTARSILKVDVIGVVILVVVMNSNTSA